MRESTAFLLLLGAGSTSIFAQPAAPPGPPPSFRVVTRTVPEKGRLTFFVSEPRNEQFPYTEKIIVDGKAVDVTKVGTRVVYVMEQVTISIADSRVITPDGKQLPIDEVWKRLKNGSVIVMSADGNVPARAYLQTLAPTTLVIIQTALKK